MFHNLKIAEGQEADLMIADERTEEMTITIIKEEMIEIPIGMMRSDIVKINKLLSTKKIRLKTKIISL